jgi:hypothetical protein
MHSSEVDGHRLRLLLGARSANRSRTLEYKCLLQKSGQIFAGLIKGSAPGAPERGISAQRLHRYPDRRRGHAPILDADRVRQSRLITAHVGPHPGCRPPALARLILLQVKCATSAKRRRSEKGVPILEGERRSNAGDPIRLRLCQKAERDLRERRYESPSCLASAIAHLQRSAHDTLYRRPDERRAR